VEALIELGWNGPWNFTAHVQPVNIDFALRYFAYIVFFSPKTNKFNPVPVQFSKLSK